MLKTIRIALAAFFFAGITWLFLDVTETAQHLLGWMARIQFLPAVLALSIGIVALLILLTLLFGRIYCSTICPLGVFQDIFAWLGTRRKKNRYHFSKARNSLRYGALAAFIVLSVLGVHSLALLLAPYSAYGRIAQNLFSPVYRAGNNLLALLAERADSYAFSASDISIRSWPTFGITLALFVLIVFLAFRHGRIWCNTLCPVGTVLGFLSRFAWFRPTLDREKCVSCHLCEERCKAGCINIQTQTVDSSRCVVCMNCIGDCPEGAIRLTHEKRESMTEAPAQIEVSPSAGATRQANLSTARRDFLLALPAVLSMALPAGARAEDNRTDGGLAGLKPRRQPKRALPVRPPGALGQKNFTTRCTACQLCVAACPNGVLRPSTSALGLMQPEMGFDKGFCRPECRRCSDICPSGAIQPIGDGEKSAIHIGYAVWDKTLCLPANGEDECGHCPNASISLIGSTASNGKKVQVPAVDKERCIGCGACEYVCPARPVSAIHVEGYEVHRIN